MRSAARIEKIPIGVPLMADDVLEFHAGRLLLLLSICGTRERIDGLTKLAKLDFFVRYPAFFAKLCSTLNVEYEHTDDIVDSAMVRYHYGPWDKRYYQVLGFLEARRLIDVHKVKNTFRFALTREGGEIATKLKAGAEFRELCEHMQSVKSLLGNKSGSTLKNLVYRTFDEEVAQQELGQVIKS